MKKRSQTKFYIAVLVFCSFMLLISFVNSKDTFFKPYYENNDILEVLHYLSGVMAIGVPIVVVMAVPVFVMAIKNKRKIMGGDITNESTIIRCKAKIVSKNTYSPQGTLENIDFVIFQKESGERVKLAIENTDIYELMMLKDEGVLVYSGKRFISFHRDEI